MRLNSLSFDYLCHVVSKPEISGNQSHFYSTIMLKANTHISSL